MLILGYCVSLTTWGLILFILVFGYFLSCYFFNNEMSKLSLDLDNLTFTLTYNFTT